MGHGSGYPLHFQVNHYLLLAAVVEAAAVVLRSEAEGDLH